MKLRHGIFLRYSINFWAFVNISKNIMLHVESFRSRLKKLVNKQVNFNILTELFFTGKHHWRFKPAVCILRHFAHNSWDFSSRSYHCGYCGQKCLPAVFHLTRWNIYNSSSNIHPEYFVSGLSDHCSKCEKCYIN